MNRSQHWNSVYTHKTDCELSWTQPNPSISLSLIREQCRSGRIIDVGGGSSRLADRLLDAGYTVTVLDISNAALARAKARLGPRVEQIQWIVADITTHPQLGDFDVWHDRAVFHFLTEPADRAAYIALLTRTISVNGDLVMATFAPDGPERCSGLPVQRYDSQTLATELGQRFALVNNVSQIHVTPHGRPQSFQYSAFKRI